MNNSNNINISCYVVSVILHLLLLLGVVFYLDFSTLPFVAVSQQAPVVQAYSYEAMPFPKQAKKMVRQKPVKQQQQILRPPGPSVIALQKKEKRLQKNKQVLSQENVKKQMMSQEKRGIAEHQAEIACQQKKAKTETLLTILHAAIQKQQRYPLSALEMRRQGRATVRFILEINGTVRNVRIGKTSGTASLDRAAMAAVLHAQPFRQVETYLDASRDFSIDVVFALA